MELNKNSFPINLDREEALILIESNFKKKGHILKLNKDKLYLTVVPYWFCFYDIHTNNKDNGFETISGQTALNALTNKIEENYINLFENSSPRLINKIKLQGIEKINIKIKKQIVSLEESKITITKLLCAKYKVPNSNVSLSGFVEIWIPFWKKMVGKEEYKLDAVTGTINNFDKIKIREKTDSELFLEMLEDLKNPSIVLKYISELFVSIYRFLKYIFKFLIKHKSIVLVILVCILLYLLSTV